MQEATRGCLTLSGGLLWNGCIDGPRDEKGLPNRTADVHAELLRCSTKTHLCSTYVEVVQKKKISNRKRMIWTQSQAMMLATVSRVCLLGHSFDRITEYVQNVGSLRSHGASEQAGRVGPKVPNDGDGGGEASSPQPSTFCCMWTR